MDEKLKRQIVGGAVLLIALVVVINWLGNGASDDPEIAAELAQNRETRVYDLSQLDTEGPLARAPAPEEPAAAAGDPAAEGLPPDTAQEPKAAPPPSEPVLAPPPAQPAAPAPATAAAEPPPGPAPKPAPAAGGNWVVQVGSYSSEPNARALKTRLQQEGYATELAAVTLDGRPMYRLRVGPYGDEAAAREAAGRLEEALRQKVSVLKR